MAPLDWEEHVSGMTLTSMRIGGPVQYVARPTTRESLEATLNEARELNLTTRFFGGGSNTILADEGFVGLLVIPSNRSFQQETGEYAEPPVMVKDRYGREADRGFLALNEEVVPSGESAWVTLGAGMPWGQAVMQTLDAGLVGLHYYARIPCTVGGAIYNNIHGEKHFVSECVQAVTSYDTERGWVTRLPSELDFGYDHSIFHTAKHEAIWEVTWKLTQSAAAADAKEQYLTWTKAKVVAQPSGANCGSVFQNLDANYVAEQSLPSVAAGWYIDHAGCQGWREGALVVSNLHANFITNEGGGTQADFIRLVERVRARVYEAYGVILTPEVECLTASGTTVVWK